MLQASRPFILTKSDLQKQVFGAGYPSVPTYTVEEFYEAQVRAGQLPPPGSAGYEIVTSCFRTKLCLVVTLEI